jgi:glycosyltransferase 2 family protein
MRALRICLVVAVLGALAWFVRGLRFDLLEAAFQRARSWPIVLGGGLALLALVWRSLCWKVLLRPAATVATTDLFRYTVAAFATSALVPARAGEVVRVWLLERRNRVPASLAAATAVAEKVVDAFAMLLVVAPIPWLLPALPRWVGRSIAGLGVVGVAALVVCRLARPRARPEGGFARFLAALDVLGAPRRILPALGLLLAAWLTDLAEVWLVLGALDIRVPFSAGLLVLLTVNLAIVVPSTPAQVGALELGAVLGLRLLGVAKEDGLAFALLYHGMQVIPLVLAALLDVRLVLSASRPRPTTPTLDPGIGPGPRD